MLWLQAWIDIPAFTLGFVGIFLLVLNRRVLLILLLGLQYVLAAWLMLGSIQLMSAGAVLLAGMLSTCMLYLSMVTSRVDAREEDDPAFPSNLLFRISVGVLGILSSVGALRAQIIQLADLEPVFILGALFTLSSGFIQLGVTRSPFRVVVGLLSMLTGFTVLYTALEPSLAVVALLALVHLGVALTGSYILLNSSGSLSVQGGPR
jgi:hypothetical protein